MTFALGLWIVAGGIIWFLLVARIDPFDVIFGAAVILTGWKVAARFTEAETPVPVSQVPGRTFRLMTYFILTVLPALRRSTWNFVRCTLGLGCRYGPAIVAVHLPDASPNELFLLSYVITLSPGEQVIAVDEAHHILYIHALDVSDAGAYRDNVHKQYMHLKEILP